MPIPIYRHENMKRILPILLFALACNLSARAAALPKVVLVGDSIRLSYQGTVRQQLAGKAEISSPKANGGDSANVLKHLQQWVISEKPDVVHFNCGIHDTKHFKETGKFQVSPEQYEANLRQIVNTLRAQTKAVVLFATSTPILDDRAAEKRKGRDYELTNKAIEQYNAIAVRVMRELKVPVDDLNALVAHPQAPHTTATLIVSDGVHMTPAAQKLLGEQVARFISERLHK